MRKLKWVPYVYLPLSFLDTYLYNNNMLVHYGSIPLGAITAIIFMSYLIEKGKVKENKLLSESSFFVFCMHMTIMWEMGKLVFMLLHLGDDPLTLLLFFYGVVTLTILVCLVTYVVLNKYVPKFCRLLTGGR
jgi:hypothetical protein